MKRMIFTTLMGAALFMPSIAKAGHWVTTYGPTKQAAMDNAMGMAQAMVDSGRAACIGHTEGSPFREPAYDGPNHYRAAVHVSYHNGSCGIDEGLVQDFERETL